MGLLIDSTVAIHAEQRGLPPAVPVVPITLAVARIFGEVDTNLELRVSQAPLWIFSSRRPRCPETTMS
ncbi:MAG: hypothetical protein OXQ31_05160 [Spirochaetaceae bacterium]|nr:hypothetical protein [Spirochaetaceae bacterium]MDE0221841.1 hypothetical protein [Spirochaetaceae bacterium]